MTDDKAPGPSASGQAGSTAASDLGVTALETESKTYTGRIVLCEIFDKFYRASDVPENLVRDWIEFNRLGWKAFQDLSVAITTEVLGQTVEYFLPEKDGGRDGAFAGTWKDNGDEITGAFCIQCKHTSRPKQTLSSRALMKQEAAKIKRWPAPGLVDTRLS
jgi:hypothetical protein